MTIVDSSVWVDWFRGNSTAGSQALDRLLGREELAIGDLILVEVLQGCTSDAEYLAVSEYLRPFPVLDMVGRRQAVRAAELFRMLRTRGVTVRKTIDILIAAFCLQGGYALLTADRDFDPVAEHFGLELVA